MKRQGDIDDDQLKDNNSAASDVSTLIFEQNKLEAGLSRTSHIAYRYNNVSSTLRVRLF